MNNALHPIAGMGEMPLVWQTPTVNWRQLFSGEQKPHVLLAEGTETAFVALYRQRPLRIIEASGTWQLVSPGLLSASLQVFDPDERLVGELRYGFGSTRLSLHNGQLYHWKRGVQWEDDYHSPILTFSRKWTEPGRARLQVGPECRALPELALLAGLGWHLILQADESAAATAASVSVSG